MNTARAREIVRALRAMKFPRGYSGGAWLAEAAAMLEASIAEHDDLVAAVRNAEASRDRIFDAGPDY